MKVQNGENIQIYQVSLNDTSTLFNADINYTLLKCNNGAKLSFADKNINVQNIKNDIFCTYYNSSVEAINSLDDSENYLIYLKNENIENELRINKGKNLTMDLNGFTLLTSSPVYNYSNLFIISTNLNYGYFTRSNNDNNNSSEFLIVAYDNSNLILNHVEFSTSTNVIDIYDNATFETFDSRLLSSNLINSSTVWLHGGNTTAKINDSYIEGPYAIGGEGGIINIDSSTLIGNKQNGIQVNTNYYGNILIEGNSSVTGKLVGIQLYSGDLALQEKDSNLPSITGNGGFAIRFIDLTNSSFKFNGGNLYGTSSMNFTGLTVNLPAGKKMVTVNENGVYHTYLQ